MEENYVTLSQTIDGLKEEGYTLDFNLQENCIACHRTNTVLSPDEFVIDRVYRFEGASNPDDSSILYAISSPKFNVKGILVNAYGIYADDTSAAMVQKLQMHGR